MVGKNNVQDLIYDMVKEVREDQKVLNEKVDRIEVQTTKTNGRVSALEKLNNDLAAVKQAAAVEKKWWAEYIAKYGLQTLTVFIALLALIIAYQGRQVRAAAPALLLLPRSWFRFSHAERITPQHD